MADSTLITVINQELFERVYPSGGCYVEYYRYCAYLCSPERKVTIYFYNHRGNNELGLFLDCLYHMGMTNPTINQTAGLAYVFSKAKAYVLNGYLRKGDDISNAVKKSRFEKDNAANDTAFDQQCFIFTYLLGVSYDKMIIAQQDDGKLFVKRETSFVEPQDYEINDY